MNSTTNEEDRNGLTMSDIFRTIFRKKWLALIIAAAITIGGTLGLYFGVNSTRTRYVSTFTVDFPGSDADEPKFPDNTPFNYRNIISAENLLKVKNSDEEFNGIPVEDMFANGGITITRDVVELATSGMKDVSYTVTVAAQYFKNKALAAKFINGLASVPIEYVMTMITGQDAYLEAYESETDYERKTGYLSSQLDYLSAKFGALQNHMKDNDYNSIVNRINTFRTQLNAVIGVLHTEYYVAAADTLAYYEKQITAMREISVKKTEELKLLFGAFDGKTPDSSIILGGQASSDSYIRALAQEISTYNTLVSTYQAYIDRGRTPDQTPESFKTSMNSIYEEMKTLTSDYLIELKKYYENVTAVAYGGAPVGEVGKINVLSCIIISLIAGVLIAGVVAYAAGAYSATKAKNARTAETAPSVPDENTGE